MKFAKIVYTPVASQILARLHPETKRPLRQLIENLAEKPYLGKPFKDEFEGLRSLRYKKYRVIYRLVDSDKRIEILFAGPRVDVYAELAKLLKRGKMG